MVNVFVPFNNLNGLYYMGVSKNSGTPKSSILIGFSIINHTFWGTPISETPKWLILIEGSLDFVWKLV